MSIGSWRSTITIRTESYAWRISLIITTPLILELFYWLVYVTWYKSPDRYNAIAPARVDICPPIVSVGEKHSQHKNFKFSFLLFNMEGNQTIVIESSDGDIKKLMANAVPESTKESAKYAVNVIEGGESHE